MDAKRCFFVVCRGAVSTVFGVLSLLADLTRGHPGIVAAKLGLGGVVLSLTGLVAACGDKEDTESGDEDSYYWYCYTGPPSGAIDAVSYGYDEDSWQYLVELIGWAELATLDIHAEDGAWTWDELHEMDQGEFDPDGAWDSWELDLAVVTDEADQQAGLTTLFPADEATEATMSWRVVLYDAGYPYDCAVWGRDPGYFDDINCREITFE